MRNVISRVIVIVEAFLTAYAFAMNNVESIQLSNNPNRILFWFVFILFFIFYNKVFVNKKIYYFSSIFLAVIQVVSFSYATNNDLSYIFASKLHIAKTLVCFCGFLIFFNWICNYVDMVVSDMNINQESTSYSYWTIFGILGLLWLPHVLVSYPASFTPDSIWQFLQATGVESMSNHNPVFHTCMMGFFAKMGKLFFHSANIGIFIFIAVQYIFVLSVFSYSLFVLQEKKLEKKIFYFIFIIYAFCPLIIGYLGVVIKDVPYATAFLLMMTCYIRLYSKKYTECSNKTMILFVVSGALMILNRNEGKYVFAISAIIICILYLRKCNKKNKWIKSIIILVVPIILATGIKNTIMIRNNAIPGSDREMFSLFFQQTARVVSRYGNELPDEEKDVIDNILKWDTLAERYNPMISDPVKNYYNETRTNNEMMQYFVVWGKELLRYPFTCLSATLNQNYLMFSIYSDDRIYYDSAELDFWGVYSEELSNVSQIEKIQKQFILLYKEMHDLPIISWFCDRSFYCIMLVILTSVIFAKKRYLLLNLIPLWLTIFIAILGPTIMGHPRYLFSIVYSLPFVFGSCIVFYREN